jgi:hypothetical protein
MNQKYLCWEMFSNLKQDSAALRDGTFSCTSRHKSSCEILVTVSQVSKEGYGVGKIKLQKVYC